VKLSRRASIFAVCAGAAWPVVARGQTWPRIALGVGLTPSWEETTTQGTPVSRTGLLREGTLGLGVSVLSLDVRYRQGTLRDSGGTDQQDLVEGHALLGVRFGPWLTLEAGPHLRAHVTPAGTERWVFWEGMVQAAARVIRPGGWVYLRVGRVLTADMPGLTLDHGQGADAGLELRLGSSPLWAHVGYWVNQTSASGGVRVETVQGVSLGMRLRRGATP
jgi:hypothetical protein